MQVGPHIWVGRVYVVNPVEALRLTPRTPVEKAVFQLSEHYVNATVMNAFTALGIEGPDSQPVKRAAVFSRSSTASLVNPLDLLLPSPPSLHPLSSSVPTSLCKLTRNHCWLSPGRLGMRCRLFLGHMLSV